MKVPIGSPVLPGRMGTARMCRNAHIGHSVSLDAHTFGETGIVPTLMVVFDPSTGYSVQAPPDLRPILVSLFCAP